MNEPFIPHMASSSCPTALAKTEGKKASCRRRSPSRSHSRSRSRSNSPGAVSKETSNKTERIRLSDSALEDECKWLTDESHSPNSEKNLDKLSKAHILAIEWINRYIDFGQRARSGPLLSLWKTFELTWMNFRNEYKEKHRLSDEAICACLRGVLRYDRRAKAKHGQWAHSLSQMIGNVPGCWSKGVVFYALDQLQLYDQFDPANLHWRVESSEVGPRDEKQMKDWTDSYRQYILDADLFKTELRALFTRNLTVDSLYWTKWPANDDMWELVAVLGLDEDAVKRSIAAHSTSHDLVVQKLVTAALHQETKTIDHIASNVEVWKERFTHASLPASTEESFRQACISAITATVIHHWPLKTDKHPL